MNDLFLKRINAQKESNELAVNFWAANAYDIFVKNEIVYMNFDWASDIIIKNTTDPKNPTRLKYEGLENYYSPVSIDVNELNNIKKLDQYLSGNLGLIFIEEIELM